MARTKSGRVLFWITVACALLFAIDGQLLTRGWVSQVVGGEIGMASMIGFITGGMWLKLKWTQTKARAARAGWDRGAA